MASCAKKKIKNKHVKVYKLMFLINLDSIV